jgi:hypothetical protein
MSGDVEDWSHCEAIQGEVAELALGALSGRRRSEMLDHVGACHRCSTELKEHEILADALLQLAPPRQPPVGFELRLAQRLQEAATPRPGRFQRVSALCAAAVVLLVLGFGLGALVASGDGEAHSRPATATRVTANLTSNGQVLGELTISPGRPAWLFITIDRGGWPGAVTCDVTLAGGRVETIGVFQVPGEYGAWATPLKSAADQVRSAQLVASSGTVLASAQFRL